jgi:hypothetical protein
MLQTSDDDMVVHDEAGDYDMESDGEEHHSKVISSLTIAPPKPEEDLGNLHNKTPFTLLRRSASTVRSLSLHR